MITRSDFIKTKSGILKGISIFIAVIFSIALVFFFVYSKFGIAGFAGLLGLDKQQDLKTWELVSEEADYLYNEFGFDITEITPGELKGRKKLALTLSSAGMTEVINAFRKDSETLSNLQVEVSDSQTLMLSAVGNVDLILSAFGESKEFVESSIGTLPDDVPVFIELETGGEGAQPEIRELKIGATKIPGRMVSLIDPYINEGLEMLFDNTMDIRLDELYIEDGNIMIEGEFPGR